MSLIDKLKDIDLSNIEITIPDKDDISDFVSSIKKRALIKHSADNSNEDTGKEFNILPGKREKSVRRPLAKAGKNRRQNKNINIKNIGILNTQAKRKEDEEDLYLTPEERLGKSQKEFKQNYKKRVIHFNLYTETAFITFLIAAVFIISQCVIIRKVSGNGMVPTLKDGTYIIINRLAYIKKEPERGDIITSNGSLYRITAVPGDTIEINSGRYFINGTEVDEKYEDNISSWYPRGNLTEQILDDNEYCLLKDNREDIDDSRKFGLVNKDCINGKVIVVL